MRAKGYAFCALPSEAFHKGEIQVGEAGNVLRSVQLLANSKYTLRFG